MSVSHAWAEGSAHPSWRAEDLHLQWAETEPGHAHLDAELAQLAIASLPQAFSSIRLHCDDSYLDAEQFGCRNGSLSLTHPVLGSLTAALSLSYSHAGAYQLDFSGIKLAQGELEGSLHGGDEPGVWELSLQARHLSLRVLLEALGGKQALAGFSADGAFALVLLMRGAEDGISGLNVSLDFRPLSFSNAASTYVAEKLRETLNLTAERKGTAWEFSTDTSLAAGQLYLEPVFLDLAAAPVSIALQGRFDTASKNLSLRRCAYRHTGILALRCAGNVRLEQHAAPENLAVSIEKTTFDRLYTTYLKPFLIGGAMDDLMVSGNVAGSFEIKKAVISTTKMSLDHVGVRDQKGRYSVEGLDLSFGWNAEATGQRSVLRFDRASVYQVPLGAAQFALIERDGGLALEQPARLPILDGSFNVTSFALTRPSSGKSSLAFSAELNPISLPALSAALGWPQMSGTLAGTIPDARYSDGMFTLGGQLSVRAFDGRIAIDHLALADPFSSAPQLHADIGIERLNLKDITSAFSFGSIEGLLSGAVKDLELIDWQPTRFELSLATPEDDDSRHRISQKAIDNLTRVGNGVSGVLSHSFLRFFKEFSYDRLGLSCKLEGALCEMSGVKPHDGGYYIVKGAGLPRVDVIGYTRKVAWQDLVRRLQATDFSASPIVN